MSCPTLSLLITPCFDPEGAVSHLSACLKFQNLTFDQDGPLVELRTKLGAFPTQQYDGKGLQAADENGGLELNMTDGGPVGNLRTWTVARKTHGDILLQFNAYPMSVTRATRIGGRSDLRSDQGGIQGMGLTWIPVPPIVPEGKNTYTIIVQWDLFKAPAGTRAVWTFGEGPSPIERTGPPTDLSYTIYKVGPIMSYPEVAPPRELDVYGMYWFGTPPAKVTRLGPFCQTLFTHLSKFFNDTPTPSNPYRIFVRRPSPARGHGGSACLRSFVFEFDDSIADISEDEMFHLMMHEIVHNWPLMESATLGDGATTWYNEGIAEYYSAMLPVRFGLRTPEQFLRTVNAKLTAYYTNPARGESNMAARSNALATSHHHDIAYSRGFVYLLSLNAAILSASHGAHSLDTIVHALLAARKAGRAYGLAQFLALLDTLLGATGLAAWEAMADGTRMSLPPDTLGPAYRLVRVDKPVLDFGLDDESFTTRVVGGLDPASRAAEAGLREGDEIVANTFCWQCRADYGRKMELAVLRRASEAGKEVRVEYWPRGWEAVEAWEFERVQ